MLSHKKIGWYLCEITNSSAQGWNQKLDAPFNPPTFVTNRSPEVSHDSSCGRGASTNGRKNVMIAEPIVRKLHFFLHNPKHNTKTSNILEQISPHISFVKSGQFYYQLKLNFNIIKLIQKSIWFRKNLHIQSSFF